MAISYRDLFSIIHGDRYDSSDHNNFKIDRQTRVDFKRFGSWRVHKSGL
jgi:hypothetical protein